jgi:hypothetical protein
MDHNLAHESYAAERYLLGEMTSAERDDFEEHFLSCRICGENIYGVSVFAENAKALFRDDSIKASGSTKGSSLKRIRLARAYLPVALLILAILGLAAIIAYQNVVTIPRLLSLQSMAAPVILVGEKQPSLLPTAPAGRPLRFQMMVERPPGSDRVQVDLIDAAGKTVSQGSVDTPGPDQPIDIFFPGSLPPGSYTLIARGESSGNAARVEAARSPFKVANKPQ